MGGFDDFAVLDWLMFWCLCFLMMLFPALITAVYTQKCLVDVRYTYCACLSRIFLMGVLTTAVVFACLIGLGVVYLGVPDEVSLLLFRSVFFAIFAGIGFVLLSVVMYFWQKEICEKMRDGFKGYVKNIVFFALISPVFMMWCFILWDALLITRGEY